MSTQFIQYVPRTGDRVAARRKTHSRIYCNLIVGPVTDTWDNACRVAFTAANGKPVEFRLYYSDWSFQFLFAETTKESL